MGGTVALPKLVYNMLFFSMVHMEFQSKLLASVGT
jgi:hypothetical protein